MKLKVKLVVLILISGIFFSSTVLASTVRWKYRNLCNALESVKRDAMSTFNLPTNMQQYYSNDGDETMFLYAKIKKKYIEVCDKLTLEKENNNDGSYLKSLQDQRDSLASLYGELNTKYENVKAKINSTNNTEKNYIKAKTEKEEMQNAYVMIKREYIKSRQEKERLEKTTSALHDDLASLKNKLTRATKYKSMLIAKSKSVHNELVIARSDKDRLVIHFQQELEDKNKELKSKNEVVIELESKLDALSKAYEIRLNIKERFMEILKYLNQYTTQYEQIFKIGGLIVILLALILFLLKKEFVLSVVLIGIGVCSALIPQLTAALFILAASLTMIIYTIHYIILVLRHGIKAAAVTFGYLGVKMVVNNVKNYKKEEVE